jgi:hypothetical protein
VVRDEPGGDSVKNLLWLILLVFGCATAPIVVEGPSARDAFFRRADAFDAATVYLVGTPLYEQCYNYFVNNLEVLCAPVAREESEAGETDYVGYFDCAGVALSDFEKCLGDNLDICEDCTG